MHIVISEPWEKDGPKDIYAVEHDTKSKEDFEREWDEIKEAVKTEDPEEWNVSQILVKLKRRGWQILHVTPINVEY
jgi:hypothetical protein